MKLKLLFLIAMTGPFAHAAPAVLIEQRPVEQEIDSVESETQAESEWNREDSREPASEIPVPVPPQEDDGDNAPYEDLEPVQRSSFRPQESYQSLSQFRMKRRMGVGAAFMGRAGFVGLDAELNLHPSHSLLASVGGGPGYSGTSIGYKWTPLEGTWHPTASLAFSNWSTDDQGLHDESSIPAFFRPNPGQPKNESIQQLYVVPALGLQALKLSGEGVGGMMFVEFLFFAKVPTFALSPIGSVGAKFFF